MCFDLCFIFCLLMFVIHKIVFILTKYAKDETFCFVPSIRMLTQSHFPAQSAHMVTLVEFGDPICCCIIQRFSRLGILCWYSFGSSFHWIGPS